MADVVTLKPWLVTRVVHVHPGNDRIEHGLGMECICQPEAETFDHGDGNKGITVTHKALDGRKN